MSLLGLIAERMRGAAQATAARSPLDDAVLLRSQQSAAESQNSAASACQQLGATLAEQRAQLDAAGDKGRLMVTRAQDARATMRRARDSLERTKLVALNTGLDGAKQGEARGRALVLVAEELANIARGGLTSLDELEQLFDEVEREREELGREVEAARSKGGEMSQGLLRTQAALRSSQDAVERLGKVLGAGSGGDLENARLLADVAEHARGLVTALSDLSEGSRTGLVWRALRPTLAPLLRLLRELEVRTHSGEDDP
jgi:hypothetical protein